MSANRREERCENEARVAYLKRVDSRAVAQLDKHELGVATNVGSPVFVVSELWFRFFFFRIIIIIIIIAII